MPIISLTEVNTIHWHLWSKVEPEIPPAKGHFVWLQVQAGSGVVSQRELEAGSQLGGWDNGDAGRAEGDKHWLSFQGPRPYAQLFHLPSPTIPNFPNSYHGFDFTD